MSDVAVYGHWICPYVTRVEFALAQRGVERELVNLPPSAVRGPDFVLPPEFVEHSPKLEVPMVRVADEYLADSIPILEWLETAVDAPALLPADAAGRDLVRERMAWIDRNAFWPMAGVYYGTDPEKIAKASEKLGAALAQLGAWADETGWLAGAEPSLADAVAVPIHVRLAGLQRLGLTAPIDPSWTAHGERIRRQPGWTAVEWSAEQTDEFVGRFEAHRRKQARMR